MIVCTYMSPPPFPKYLSVFLSFLLILFICHSAMSYIPFFICTENISAKDAENWLVAENKTNDPDEKFRCLQGALKIYAVERVSTMYFNWRYIVSKMSALHHNNDSLKIAEEPICIFCQERSMESLDLIGECVVSDLISYNHEGNTRDPLLGFLLQSIEMEMQGNNAAYVDKAVDVVTKAIRKGARLESFSSCRYPMTESELVEKALKIADFELFKLLMENKIISEPVLREAKHRVYACGNRDIIQWYRDWESRNSP